MKSNKIVLTSAALLVLLSCSLYAKREVVDKIIARANGSNILMSDLEQPRLDRNGGTYSLEEAIESELLLQKAAERKLLPSPTDIEKYISSWKSTNRLSHLTDDEFASQLKKEGLSIARYKLQLARILASKNLKQLETSERIVVSKTEVEDYFKRKPQYEEDQYLMKTVIISFDELGEEKDEAKINQIIKDKKDIDWIDLDWTDKDDVADQMHFVYDMKKGEISRPVKTDIGYQFVQLVDRIDRHKKTLDESYVDIEKKIQEKKQKKFEDEFIHELREKASIVYLT